MNKTKVAIATVTWARNQSEKALLMETMKILSRQNIPVVTSDGGSTEDFLDYLDTLSNFRIKRFHSPGICDLPPLIVPITELVQRVQPVQAAPQAQLEPGDDILVHCAV